MLFLQGTTRLTVHLDLWSALCSMYGSNKRPTKVAIFETDQIPLVKFGLEMDVGDD